jgi:outer membrane murein-binding lipoprotein Lpp
MLRIGRTGTGGLALRAIVLGVCLLAGCVRSASPVELVNASHLGSISTAG